MIIYSEILNKPFDSVDECLTAEKEFKEAEAKKELEEKARKAELDAAYKEAIAACDRYLELAGIKVDIDVKEDDAEDDEVFDLIDALLKDIQEIFE